MNTPQPGTPRGPAVEAGCAPLDPAAGLELAVLVLDGQGPRRLATVEFLKAAMPAARILAVSELTDAVYAVATGQYAAAWIDAGSCEQRAAVLAHYWGITAPEMEVFVLHAAEEPCAISAPAAQAVAWPAFVPVAAEWVRLCLAAEQPLLPIEEEAA